MRLTDDDDGDDDDDDLGVGDDDVDYFSFRFSIWSTMMGTSTLSIPWAIEKVSLIFFCRIFVIVMSIDDRLFSDGMF